MTPFEVKNQGAFGQGTIAVPCGKCPACCARRTSAWSFRLMQEDKVSISSLFLTLTYATKNLPFTAQGAATITKKDLQDFFKRLRKAHEKDADRPGIKYYAVGEYGGETKRPHYHVILFNADLRRVQAAWDLGQCNYGTVTGASVGYTLKYLSKPKLIPAFDGDDRQPEFSLMSKRLGASYVNERTKAWHTKNLQNRMHCVIEDGKKISMPRYYKDKIYSDEQKKAAGYGARANSVANEKLRKQQAIQQGQSDYDSASNQTQAIRAAFDRMAANSKKLDKL